MARLFGSSGSSPVSGMSSSAFSRMSDAAKDYYLEREMSKSSKSSGSGLSALGSTNLQDQSDTDPVIQKALDKIIEIAGNQFGPQGGGGATSMDDPSGPTAEESADLFTSSPEFSIYQESLAQSQSIIDQQAQQLEQVQARFDEIAAQADARDTELSQLIEGQGSAERERLENQRKQLVAEAKADFRRRGLNSTALDAVVRGIHDTSNASLNDLEESLRKQTLDYRAALSGDTLTAQAQAAGFAQSAAAQQFSAGQAQSAMMQDLAGLLSNQRIAGWQNQTQLQSARGQNQLSGLNSILGFKTDLLGLAQRERESQRDEQLGYAGLRNQMQQQRLQSATSENVARINQPRQRRVTYGALYGMQ